MFDSGKRARPLSGWQGRREGGACEARNPLGTGANRPFTHISCYEAGLMFPRITEGVFLLSTQRSATVETSGHSPRLGNESKNGHRHAQRAPTGTYKLLQTRTSTNGPDWPGGGFMPRSRARHGSQRLRPRFKTLISGRSHSGGNSGSVSGRSENAPPARVGHSEFPCDAETQGPPPGITTTPLHH